MHDPTRAAGRAVTVLLGRISGPEEVETAVAGGVDIVELAYGAPIDRVRATVAAVAGRCRVAARAENASEAAALAACGIDDLVVPAEAAEALVPLASEMRLIGLLRPEACSDPQPPFAGLQGVMLEAVDGRLLDQADLLVLRRFVSWCSGQRLISILAGRLEMPDVPRLLVLGPGALGFRTVLCDADGSLSLAAVQRIRALLPRDTTAEIAPAIVGPTDCIFLHDFTLPAHIGVYAHERQAPQTVRCNVDAFITRLPRPVSEMRDVVTYDMIGDAIRLLIGAGHIDFLETLAERLAARLLAHPRIVRVVIRLEKLDLGAGIVGVAIERSATPGADPAGGAARR